MDSKPLWVLIGPHDDYISKECPVCKEPFTPTNDEEWCSYHCATGG